MEFSLSAHISFRELNLALGDLGLDSESRIIVHVSKDIHSGINGGAETIMGALMENARTIITPAFTYRTIVSSPVERPMETGADQSQLSDGEAFHPRMPVDDALGPFPELLRHHPDVVRSAHPILSFVGLEAEEALGTQSREDPLSPVEWLGEYDGDVLLIDADHTNNISIHLGERIAGRATYTLSARTESGVVECDHMPGCSKGFEAIRSRLEGVSDRISLGDIQLELVPVRDLLHITSGWIREDPKALLCGRSECQTCPVIRASFRQDGSRAREGIG